MQRMGGEEVLTFTSDTPLKTGLGLGLGFGVYPVDLCLYYATTAPLYNHHHQTELHEQETQK